MKENEVKYLMVSDWVQFSDYKDIRPMYVRSVNGNSVMIEDIFDLPDGYYAETFCDKIEAMPLTVEMLELNGFEHIKDDSFDADTDVLVLKKGKSEILISYRESYEKLDSAGNEEFVDELWTLTISSNAYFYKENKSIYVHELQHALRLCGLPKFADNFTLR